MTNWMRTWMLAGLAALAVVGCGGPAPSTSENQPAANTPTDSNAPFKVALLTPGPISDSGWNAMAYEGLKAIEKELGATVNNEEATGGKIRDSMRSYAQEGYQLVIGHGFEYNEPATLVAPDFPKTMFVSSSGGKTAANVGAFRFYLEQGFYLAGMFAAEMSKSGKLATVAIQNIPSIDSTLKAFEAGAKAHKPNIVIIPIKIASDRDDAAAKQATLAALDQGADVVIHQANSAAQGVFNACKEKGAMALGANSDQNANDSGAVVASAVIVAKPAFVDLARRVKEGKYQGEIALQGMSIGAIDFVIREDFQPKVPKEFMDKLAKTRKDIETGALVVPKDEF